MLRINQKHINNLLTLSIGNRTEWSLIWTVTKWSKIEGPCSGSPICLPRV